MPIDPTSAAQAASDALVDLLGNPKRVEGDAGTVEEHSIADMIEADRYLATKAAAQRGRRGVRFNKLIPPGTV